MQDDRSLTGVVAIGRNEGERLQRCLASLSGPVVYVDSGSTDGSRERALAAGALVEELDLSAPFTAARARNAGFERLVREFPGVELVQFVDGDCELQPGWIEAGAGVLREREDVAVVCGRRRERFPEVSVYNRLCDVEWDIPVGEVRSCGGDALVRARLFREVGGFDPALIAGEEPDLCLRLRRLGFRIVRADAEMTAHDAAMTRWTQWWQRAIRTGHTTAELLAKYGATSEHGRARRALSSLFWALAFPLAWLALCAWAVAAGELALSALALVAPLAVYALSVLRIARKYRRAGRSSADARAYAVSCVLAKWPETWGMGLYLARRLAGRRPRWIEYKDGPRGLGAPARRGERRRPLSLKQRVRPTVDRAARLTRVLAWREREQAGALTVLMYHRVLPEPLCAGYPFPSLVMPLGAFREQVRWLAEHGEVLPLAEALEHDGARRSRPLFALTFDDGYHDSGEIVAAELEAVGLRGTFFVTTGFVETNGLLWFDRAALLFSAVPERVRRDVVRDLTGAGAQRELPEPGAAVATWTAYLKGCGPQERAAILSELENAAGAPPAAAARGYRALSTDQVVDLHRRGHEIGSHGVAHELLPALDDAGLWNEVHGSRAALERWLGVEVPGFCYPNGTHDERVVAAVARAGHVYACTTRDGLHRPGDDPFRIRRVDIVAERVTGSAGRFDATAFRRELCGLYRSAARRVG